MPGQVLWMTSSVANEQLTRIAAGELGDILFQVPVQAPTLSSHLHSQHVVIGAGPKAVKQHVVAGL